MRGLQNRWSGCVVSRCCRIEGALTNTYDLNSSRGVLYINFGASYILALPPSAIKSCHLIRSGLDAKPAVRGDMATPVGEQAVRYGLSIRSKQGNICFTRATFLRVYTISLDENRGRCRVSDCVQEEREQPSTVLTAY